MGRSITRGTVFLTSVCVQADSAWLLPSRQPSVPHGRFFRYSGLLGAFEGLQALWLGTGVGPSVPSVFRPGAHRRSAMPSEPLLPTRNPPISPLIHPSMLVWRLSGLLADRGVCDHRAEWRLRRHRSSPMAVGRLCRRTHLYRAPQHLDPGVGCRGGAIGRFRPHRAVAMQAPASGFWGTSLPRTPKK
jgi:hypothetical protein